MSKMKTNLAPETSGTALLFLILVPAVVINYVTFILNPVFIGNLPTYILQVTADILAISAVLGLWITILLDQISKRKQEVIPDPAFLTKRHPTVDVLIPVANESIAIIRNTVIAAIHMEYAHTVYVLDDGGSDEVKQLCSEYKVNYIHRGHNKFAKSGNLNNGLRHCTGEFFCVIDADFVTAPSFLTTLLPYMADPKVAFVQSPQAYSNLDNFIARGTSQAQEVFYRYVLTAKNSSNSAFCVGTNVVFRRKAIDDIGGIFELDHSEDIWTSLLLHDKKWKSVFVPIVLAIGLAPDSISTYFKQQKRWAQGGFTIFFDHNPLLSKNLSLDQRLQYLFTSSFYCLGISTFIFLLLPIIYLFFGFSPVKVEHTSQWMIHYLPYVLTLYALPFLFGGKIDFATLSTSISSFSCYIQALLDTIFGRRYVWITTNSTKRGKSTPLMNYIWPHVLLIMLSVSGSIISWYNVKDVNNTLINCFWALCNAYLLCSFLVLGNAPAAKSTPDLIKVLS